MTAAESTRRIYEQRPYPATDGAVLANRYAHLPPVDWMNAIGRPGRALPQRVLVAGCGTGAEAFELRRALPDAQIVAVDYSARSIAIARRLQGSARGGRAVEFAVADLTDSRLALEIGGGFDLISCHGVLSYIARPGRVLANLAKCAHPDAVLYLGVNGESHPAHRLRRWLSAFGFGVQALSDERRLRELLRLWDALTSPPSRALAALPASYLAGDVCGNHFNNWSLSRWNVAARNAGWTLAGSWTLPPLLHSVLAATAHEPLFPSSIRSLLGRLDQAAPSPFHRLLFRQEDRQPDWSSPAPSHGCELNWTGLYTLKLSRRRRSALAVLRSRFLKLELELPLTRHQSDFFATLAAQPAGWIRCPPAWWQTTTSRRTLWLCVAFGVVSARRADAARRRADQNSETTL